MGKGLSWVMVLLLVLSVNLSKGFAADEQMGNMERNTSGMMMDEAKMQEMMKMGAPNENHQKLEPIVGTWTSSSKWWMSAEAPAEESQGTSVNSWIMNGRFLKQEFKGEAMGKPFEGMNITGYDNLKGEYSSLWIDSMSTGMMTSSGHFNPEGTVYEESGSFACPMTGEKDRWFRSAMKLIDSGHYTYEMFMKDSDGKEFRGMEIIYERVK